MSSLSVGAFDSGTRNLRVTEGVTIENALPPEMLVMILSHVRGADAIVAARVNRRWRNCYTESVTLRHRKIEEIARKMDRLFGLLLNPRECDMRDREPREALDKCQWALIDSVYELVRERDLEDSLVVDVRFKPLIELAQKLSNVKDKVLRCVAWGISQAGNSALAIEAAKHISDHAEKNAAFENIVKNLSETGNFHLMLGVLDEDEFTSESSRSWARCFIVGAAVKVSDFALAMQQVACMSEEALDLLLKDQTRKEIAVKAAEAGLFRVAISQARAISPDSWEKGDSFLSIAKAAGAAGKLDLAVDMLSEASEHPRMIPLDETRHTVIRKFVEGASVAKIIRQLGKIADKEIALAVIQSLIDLSRVSDALVVVVNSMPTAFISFVVGLCNKIVSNWLLILRS